MNQLHKVGWFFVVAVFAWLVLMSRGPDGAFDEVEFQGQRFKLTRAYDDYDEFEEDPDKFDPADFGRIEQAVRGVRIGPKYPTWEECGWAVSQLRFPGSGMTSFMTKPQTDGLRLIVDEIEIPCVNKDRVVIFQVAADGFTLVDDFVVDTSDNTPPIAQVSLHDGSLIYSDHDENELYVRPMMAPSRK